MPQESKVEDRLKKLAIETLYLELTMKRRQLVEAQEFITDMMPIVTALTLASEKKIKLPDWKNQREEVAWWISPKGLKTIKKLITGKG